MQTKCAISRRFVFCVINTFGFSKMHSQILQICPAVCCVVCSGTFALRDVLVNPQALQQQVDEQNIALDPDVVDQLLNATVNASQVRGCTGK